MFAPLSDYSSRCRESSVPISNGGHIVFRVRCGAGIIQPLPGKVKLPLVPEVCHVVCSCPVAYVMGPRHVAAQSGAVSGEKQGPWL